MGEGKDRWRIDGWESYYRQIIGREPINSRLDGRLSTILRTCVQVRIVDGQKGQQYRIVDGLGGPSNSYGWVESPHHCW